jgi:hypothetical protein
MITKDSLVLEQKIIYWLIIIGITAFNLVMLPLLILKLCPGIKGLEYLFAFAGAIIGGFLTLIGVRQTILEKRRSERLEKLPKDIIYSWKIHKHMNFPVALYSEMKEKNLNDDVHVKKFYDDHEGWITELSTKINPEVYDVVNSFFTFISDYSVYKKRGKIDLWFDEVFELKMKMMKIIDSYEKEYEKLSK